jgi:diadenosine tetraphosphate (Ap4A) HIT family hydrolase
VVLAPGASPCGAQHLTLVPKSHADVLAQLGPRHGAAVLAGLSRVSLALRKSAGMEEVSVAAHPTLPASCGEHLHFHLG